MKNRLKNRHDDMDDYSFMRSKGRFLHTMVRYFYTLSVNQHWQWCFWWRHGRKLEETSRSSGVSSLVDCFCSIWLSKHLPNRLSCHPSTLMNYGHCSPKVQLEMQIGVQPDVDNLLTRDFHLYLSWILTMILTTITDANLRVGFPVIRL